ncbi:MAG: hypothetical protein OEY59_13265 [Deltaproteobacteria bacterium]|nr:hypothetical protein [Deltaproteobacteria bacterium]
MRRRIDDLLDYLETQGQIKPNEYKVHFGGEDKQTRMKNEGTDLIVSSSLTDWTVVFENISSQLYEFISTLIIFWAADNLIESQSEKISPTSLDPIDDERDDFEVTLTLFEEQRATEDVNGAYEFQGKKYSLTNTQPTDGID